jgi:hypothetical protein
MLDDASQLITWVLVGIGWFLVNRQNDLREARKELRSKITELCKLVSDIEADATTFYARAGNAAEAVSDRGKITHKLSLLGVGVSQITPRHHPILGALVTFRQSITGDAFDEEARASLRYNNPTLDSVRAAAEMLVDQLESAFCVRYAQTAKLAEEYPNTK